MQTAIEQQSRAHSIELPLTLQEKRDLQIVSEVRLLKSEYPYISLARALKVVADRYYLTERRVLQILRKVEAREREEAATC